MVLRLLPLILDCGTVAILARRGAAAAATAAAVPLFSSSIFGRLFSSIVMGSSDGEVVVMLVASGSPGPSPPPTAVSAGEPDSFFVAIAPSSGANKIVLAEFNTPAVTASHGAGIPGYLAPGFFLYMNTQIQ